MRKLLIFPLQSWKHGEDQPSCPHTLQSSVLSNRYVLTEKKARAAQFFLCSYIQNLSGTSLRFGNTFVRNNPLYRFGNTFVRNNPLLRFRNIFQSEFGQKAGACSEYLISERRPFIDPWCCQQTLKNKKMLTSPSYVLPYYLMQTFPPIIWIFTHGEGDEIKSRLSS